MRLALIVAALALFLILLTRTASAAGPYWLQIGVFADIGTVNVTGASVQIRTHVPSNPSGVQADTTFWLGLDFTNNAFIQIGYDSCPCYGGYPVWFWEYYPPKTASAGGGRFLGMESGDNEVGPNGTWYTYSMQSSGNTWSFYVNGILEGSYNVGMPNSGGDTPSAVGEVAETYTTHVVLGPAEFRHFTWRDTNNVWHTVSSATAYVGLGAGSGTLPSSVTNPYGLQVLSADDWVAGSGLNQPSNGQSLWPESATQYTFTSLANYQSYTPYTSYSSLTTISSQPNTLQMNWRSPFFSAGLVALVVGLIIAAIIYYWPTKGGKTKGKQTKLDTILTQEPAPTPPRSVGSPEPQNSIPSPAKASPNFMFCNQCGARITRVSKFCRECGAKQD